MTHALPLAALALVAFLAVMGADYQAALDQCQLMHSYSTCAYALR